MVILHLRWDVLEDVKEGVAMEELLRKVLHRNWNLNFGFRNQ
jgi:hypothetical protein